MSMTGLIYKRIAIVECIIILLLSIMLLQKNILGAEMSAQGNLPFKDTGSYQIYTQKCNVIVATNDSNFKKSERSK